MTPYDVLGVAGDADGTTIRAAYRRLVRENHPDVALDKVAATIRMAQINQAWQILGDPAKRAAFDGSARLQKQEFEAAQERARVEAQRRARLERELVEMQRARHAGRSSAPKKAEARDKKSGKNQKTAPRDKNGRATKNSGARTKNPARETRLVHQITLAARLFHREGRADEAAKLCRAILLADGRNVPARELLGDILAFQGRIESALLLLDQAIQIAPQDRMLRRKRDQLQLVQAKRAGSQTGRATNAKTAAPGAKPKTNAAQTVSAAQTTSAGQAAFSAKTPRLSLLGRLRARFSKPKGKN